MMQTTTPVPVEGDVAGGALPMSAGSSFHGRRKPNGSACQRRTMAGVQDEAKHVTSAMSPLKSWSCEIAPWLVARLAQSGFQFLLLLCPARVLRLRSSVECSAVSFDFFDLGFMVTLRFLKRCFGLCDCLLAPLAFLLPRGLFLPGSVQDLSHFGGGGGWSGQAVWMAAAPVFSCQVRAVLRV
jgi:hypothetical protein